MVMAEITLVRERNFHQEIVLKLRFPDTKIKVGDIVEVQVKRPGRTLEQHEVLIAMFKTLQAPLALIHIYSVSEFLAAIKQYVYQTKPAFYINQTNGVGEFSTSRLDKTEFSHFMTWLEFEFLVSHLDIDISVWTEYNKK